MALYCSAFNMPPESYPGLTIVVVYDCAFLGNYGSFYSCSGRLDLGCHVRECCMWGFLWLIGAFLTLLVPLVSEGFLEEGG